MDIRNVVRSGIRQFRDYPQLWLTIIVAAAIVASFVYVATSFLNIARSAQDELTQVRIGSLQDAFAPLAAELWQQPDIMRSYMRRMQALNPTIEGFTINVQQSSGQLQVLLSSNPSEEGLPVFRQDLLLSLARADTQHSFTISETENGTRYFYTARAVVSRDNVLEGIVLTRQTLSAADEQLSTSTNGALVTLVVILLFLLLLFFRHARIIDYTVLYRKLREVDTLKDEFIGMASHELRAPLTAIRGYAEMLKDGSLDAPARALSIQRIDTSAQQLDHLIADMLDVSRIEQGRMKMEQKRIDTHATLAEQCDIWEMRAKQKGLTLARELSEGLAITVDPDRFRQVVINLISNAIKYTNHGTVTVQTSGGDGRFQLRVSDTGIGMTEDERTNLFQKFYRAAGSDVRKEAGTGLGLWITKQLIERMGGRISVESIKGVGSHFIVSFPLA